MKGQKGYALVVALMMLLVITMIGVAAIESSTSELKISGNKRASTNALYSTDGSVQLIISIPQNFLLSKYEDQKYNPYSDPENQNPANARSTITYLPERIGSPRGLGYSSTNFEYEYFNVEANAKDMVERQATSTIQEELARLVPCQQGGN
jgi:hypothetical protein